MGSFDPPISYEKHKRENQNGCNQVNNEIKLTYKHIISVTNNPDRLLQNSIWCWSARICLELIKCVFFVVDASSVCSEIDCCCCWSVVFCLRWTLYVFPVQFSFVISQKNVAQHDFFYQEYCHKNMCSGLVHVIWAHNKPKQIECTRLNVIIFTL